MLRECYSCCYYRTDINAGKTEHISYNQNGTINTINAERIKLVDDFTYLGSSIASTEKDIDIRKLQKHGAH